MNIRDILSLSAVVAEVEVAAVADAVPLARALLAGGIRILEVSMRIASAPAVIDSIRKSVPEALVGAGGMIRAVEFAAAGNAGAQFGASPGFIPELAAAARGARFPWMPSIMTPSELMAARVAGFDAVKFFPAGDAAALGRLQAIAGQFSDVVFCPSGVSTQAAAAEFLRVDNVECAAGAWMCPLSLVQGRDWAGITALTRTAAALRKHRARG